MFYRSMSAVERVHIVEAFTFELGKCYEQAIRERDARPCWRTSTPTCARRSPPDSACRRRPGKPATDAVMPSPALSQIVTEPGPIAGRDVGVVADAGADLAGIGKLRDALDEPGRRAARHRAARRHDRPGRQHEIVERTFLTARSIEFDAVVVAGGAGALADIKLDILLQEAFRHCKAIAAWGDGAQTCSPPPGSIPRRRGVLVTDPSTVASRKALIAAMGLHRAWDRTPLITGGPPESA